MFFLFGTPGQSKNDPLWAAEPLCIYIISEEMKFLWQFYTGLALSKGCCVGKWFGKLWQNQLCSLRPHSGIFKTWKTSLAAVTATIAETENTEVQNGSAKAQDSHYHSSISHCRATAHHLLGSPSPSQLHPLSCGGSNQPLESIHSLGKPWAGSGLLFSLQELAWICLGRKTKKCLRDLFFNQI